MAMGEVYIPCCRRCGKSMGEMPLEEFEACCDGDGLPGLCFDCEPGSAATVPHLFWNWHEGDSFCLGEKWLVVHKNSLVLYSLAYPRAHDRSHERDLSSYTYLNRIPENTELLASGEEVTVCPECHGYADKVPIYGGEECSTCGTVGEIICAVLIPSWILGLGCENV